MATPRACNLFRSTLMCCDSCDVCTCVAVTQYILYVSVCFYRATCLHLWIFYTHGVTLFAAPPELIYCSYPTVFQCQTVTDCGEGALASCLDMELENVEKAACGSGGMDGYRKAWSVDKEADSCYWAVGWRAEKGLVRGLLEAVHIVPLFTLTPGPREAQGGHMPNSPGGQNCPALSLTSLPAPLSPVRYMSVWSQGCTSGKDTTLHFPYRSGLRQLRVFAFEKHSSKCCFTLTV